MFINLFLGFFSLFRKKGTGTVVELSETVSYVSLFCIGSKKLTLYYGVWTQMANGKTTYS